MILQMVGQEVTNASILFHIVIAWYPKDMQRPLCKLMFVFIASKLPCERSDFLASMQMDIPSLKLHVKC